MRLRHSPNWLSRWTRKSRPVIRPSRRLEVEALEERVTPTVVFRPHYPGETLAPNSQNTAQSSPFVFVIFWGSYWATPRGNGDKTQMVDAVQRIVGSTYLNKETQYG